MTRRAAIFSIAVVVMVIATWVGLSRWKHGAKPLAVRPQFSSGTEIGANRLLRINPRQDNLNVLVEMRWSDVPPTADAAMTDAFVRDRILDEMAGSPGAPLAYVRGMLRLAKAQPEKALAEFNRVPVAEIPGPLLYAPYRLQAEVDPSAANVYAEPILRAARADTLEPLIAARVFIASTDFKSALERYLRSDPARWRYYDLSMFSLMLAHEGHRGTAAAVLQAAYRGGRMQEALKPAALETLGRAIAANRSVPADLWTLVKQNPAARDLFIKGAERQFAARLRFLKGEDTLLISEYAEVASEDASDETVTLLTLVSARHRDRKAFDRWSGELARRIPRPDVIKWITTLYPAAQ